MFIYESLTGNRTVEIDITSVPHWFKPYIGWIGDDAGETITTEARASFNNGSTWTAWATVTNRQELTAAFNESTESHADIIEVKQTLTTTDTLVSPTVECVFIYFPDFDPVMAFDLPTLSFEINVYTHAELEATLPSFLIDAGLHNAYYDRSADLTGEIPSFQASIGTGAGLITNFPSLTFEANLYPGRSVEFEATLPKLSAEWYVGSKMSATIPSLILSADLSKNEPATISASIPALNLSAQVLTGILVDMDCHIPMLTTELTGNSAIITEFLSSFPKMTLSVNALTGLVADMEGTIPILYSRISSIITGDNDIDATLPTLTAIIESGELSGILRYIKGAAR